ncbi:MAG TPA: tyrosine-protein phosphatase [Bryobacteraceae bacterium]|nr:tyrosine-protein phosphatase [Bryobacteraceae bacterium]
MRLAKFPVFLLALSLTPAWGAEPTAPGVPNFHQVNDRIFRGGQPADGGWKSLADLGIKLVVDLRPPSEHPTGREEQAVQAAGMRYVNMPMKGLRAPSDQEIAQALAILESSSQTPIFVHCRRGSDRTGTVIACYRIAHDHWPNGKALQEALSHGMSRIERGMQHYVLNFKTGRISGAASTQPSAAPDLTAQPSTAQPSATHQSIAQP